MWISGPSSRGRIISFACIWHITSSILACTPYVVQSIHHNSHMTLLTFVRDSPRFVCLCHDLSHACIGMFESPLLCPYCVDDLWTIVHHPDIGHRLCHHNRLTILEFRLSSFLTPKNNEKIAEHSCFLSCSLNYRKGHLHHLVYLLLQTM